MKKHLIYVPGLGDQMWGRMPVSQALLAFWRVRGYEGHEEVMKWEDGAPFAEKLARIKRAIDVLSAEHTKIFLLGVSAGASAVLNAYAERKDAVAGVASVAGWLRDIPEVHQTLQNTRSRSRAFVESVEMLERKTLPALSAIDRSKILTLRPTTDSVVPPHIARLDGVEDIQLPIRGHMLACALIPTLYAGKIRRFFDSK